MFNVPFSLQPEAAMEAFATQAPSGGCAKGGGLKGRPWLLPPHSCHTSYLFTQSEAVTTRKHIYTLPLKMMEPVGPPAA